MVHMYGDAVILLVTYGKHNVVVLSIFYAYLKQLYDIGFHMTLLVF